MIDIYKINFRKEKNDNEPILISVEEAMKLTGIGRNRLLKFTKQKGFPALIFPHKIRIDKKQLSIWLQKNYGIYKN